MRIIGEAATALDEFAVSPPRFRREFGWSTKLSEKKAKNSNATTYVAPKTTPSTEIEIRGYSDLITVLRTRADELQISREIIDDISGLQPGYSGKILSINQLRRLGPQTLGPLLEVLGLKLIAVPDEPDDSNSELIDALRQRAKELKRIDVRSNEFKRIRLNKLGSLLDVLCLKLMAVHDEDALRRNRPHFEKRDLPHWRSAAARHRPRD
jgi:hypothetical protein